MASSPISSWQIDGETMETVTGIIFLGSKITTDGDCSHEIKKMLTPWKESYDKPQFSSDQFILSVRSDPLQPHELQHARPPCPSQLPEFTQIHFHRISDAIQLSHPLSSPSPPALNPSQHESLFPLSQLFA